MKIPALRINQSGQILYLTKMTAEQILACCYIAPWDPDLGWDLSKQGYQRAPVASHFQSIGHFLADNPKVLMPTSALISARPEDGILDFKEISLYKDGSALGELDLADTRLFTIIDYQHRWQGLRYAIEVLEVDSLKEFTVPVTLLTNLERPDEIEQFYLINSKQKRIDTDLALALLQTLASEADLPRLRNLVGPGNAFRIRATRLTFRLAERNVSPWAGRIIQPHDLPQPGAVIRVKSFVDSLAPLLSARQAISTLGDEALLDTLVAFWQALEAVLKPCFVTPTQYQVQKTVGTFSFHLLLARKVYPLAAARGSTTRATYERLLGEMDRRFLDPGFWVSRAPRTPPAPGTASVYVGSSGYRELADLMGKEIKG